MTNKVVEKQRIFINISDKNGLNDEVARLCDAIVFSPAVYSVEAVADFLSHAKSAGAGEKIYLALPVAADCADIEVLRKILSACPVTGVLADNLYGLALADEFGVKFIAGTGLNIYNSESAKYFLSRGGEVIYSAELNFREVEDIENALSATGGKESGSACRSGRALGFAFVYGDMRAMTLCHCPAQVASGKGCGECSYKEGMIYQDEKGYKFPLRRVRLSRCYFELFNSAKLNGLKRACETNINVYFVFFGVSARGICDIINSYRQGALAAENASGGFTAGHLTKGVK